MTCITRAVDWLIVLLQCYFLLNCTTIEVPYCHAPITAANQETMLKATYDFCKEYNPLFLRRDPWMQMATCVSGYGLSVFYLFTLVAFVFKLNIVRMPAILVAGAKIYAVLFYHIMEFTSDMPPPNPSVYFAVEGPYMLGVLLLLCRTLPGPPFETMNTSKSKED
mmetsp:Transcript_14587/g.35589  ORF Transcript_14587/g.35589 Transcript_14587/m.35589 type:complete len:165 (-) Transcript_14587:349-843(-)|eukprot:CAMPEP_0114507740 /NCGR_PEP_ID=MMETSP0109-20121206/12184_1 /TAXON_ID=29199 /ORGANISM="Chlorarachnion reptans, Strain CCCM449" /LENGTH=164 /DNA_ID=CAMNT_0001686539 /DNA_START=187 /DNA_END=681 /DNA_ORIENTATION=-